MLPTGAIQDCSEAEAIALLEKNDWNIHKTVESMKKCIGRGFSCHNKTKGGQSMLLRKILLCLLTLCILFALCACGGKNAAPTTEATEEAATYTVKVVDEDGNPVTGVTVQLCKDSCLLGQTDETGVAVYQTVADDYKVSIVITPAGYAADTAEYHFAEGEQELTITLKKAV